MKVVEIVKVVWEVFLLGEFDYVWVNFVNGDMVGYIGDLEVIKMVCEVVD